jgi:predicted PurR-regulated permease PerM
MLRRRPLNQIAGISDIAVISIAGLALIAVGFSVHSILSPFVVVAAVVYLLYPFRSRVFVYRVIIVSLALLALWGFNAVFSLIVPFLIAYVLAYLLDPLVTRFAAHRLPRWIGSLVIVLGIVGLIVAAVLFVAPVIGPQIEALLNGVKALVELTITWLSSDEPLRLFARLGIPPDRARDLVSTGIVPRLEGILSALVNGVLGILTGVSSIAMQLLNVVIIPFVLFFLLKDFPDIGKGFVGMFPESSRPRVHAFVTMVDEVMGRYVRGAVFVALIQGTIATIVLWLIGVSSPLVLGIMTGLLDFIPYIGLVTSLIVASLVALFSGDPVGTKVLGVVILYLSQKLLEATVLGPKIIGSQVGLHPVVLILSLLVFGYFLGFMGLLVAVPVTALLLVVIQRHKTQGLFRT